MGTRNQSMTKGLDYEPPTRENKKKGPEMKYFLVVEQSEGNLSFEITKRLNEGWKLYGSPFSTSSTNERGYNEYGQAMVKYPTVDERRAAHANNIEENRARQEDISDTQKKTTANS